MQRRDFFRLAGASAAVTIAPRAAAQPTVAAGRPATATASVLTPLRGYRGQSVACEGAAIEGSLPTDLRGTFYRNGPALFERGGERYRHWFDGDGMVHAWQFTGKSVTHRARFVETDKFKAETAARQFLAPAFGTGFPPRQGYVVRSGDDLNTANTSVYRMGDRLLAMWEGGSATALDPATLETRGPVTWAPELRSMPFSAHPKIEPDGTFWNFGSFLGKMALYRIAASGELMKYAVFDAPPSAMVHDFAITARHLVFLLPPISVDYGALRNGKGIGETLGWNARGATQVLVIDKDDFSKRRTLELPPFMVFHFGNAWESGNAIHVDFVRSDNLDIMNDFMPRLMRGELVDAPRSTIAQLTIDLDRNRCRIETRQEDCEFPRIDPRRVGQRHANLYVVSTDRQGPRFGFPTVTRIDTASGKTDAYSFGEGFALEEHVIVPKAGAKTGEDAYLVGVGFDAARQESFATVFDALNLKAGPLAIARLPYWTPYCFHGHFHAAA